ncbi:uncharacterized protein M6B38_372420 [Iris pallida]|uniref:Uncharacterized protein n=1 Tax=Iris pallida TaxID=29817 RepID=A0AAX6GD49_IRIPA|nr:Uncharacterized protein M6B38_232610 [Iris pallida]KAJ6825989.1 uncharacterized protein M6B38_374505 [Iris pallida]KAJ6826225.1 uncharacterized protein M6B38_372420 [Iris pallida]
MAMVAVGVLKAGCGKKCRGRAADMVVEEGGDWGDDCGGVGRARVARSATVAGLRGLGVCSGDDGW